MLKYAVYLKPIHDRSGLSVHRVHKLTGVMESTIRRFVRHDVAVMTRLDPSVLELCRLYGVDWKTVVDQVEVDDKAEEEPELLTA